MRNLTRTLAVVSLLAPASAHPLGIGGIKLHSALNQNLNAEIALVLSAGENAADIKVNLAPPDKFDEAGVPWSAFLSKIKFEHSGNVIRLSSREALKEPYLDFLLEVTWPKGTMYRQFTVLVDPPATYKQATIPVATPAESYGSEPEYAVQREPAARSKPRPQRSAVSASEYGPTRPNDSLWKVAQRANTHRDVSVEQMMIALYKANPRAFYKENINALMAGKTLKIPSKEVIVQLSRKQAISEFNWQTEAWKNRKLKAPVETVKAPEEAVAEEVVVDKQLTLAAPAKATVEAKAVIAPGTEQTAAENKAVPENPAAAGEQDEDKATADAAMQNRVAELEAKLAEMQKMLALKNEQLSALQNQSQVESAVETPAQATQPATDAKVEIAGPVIQPQPQPQTKPVERPAVNPEPASDNAYYLGVGGAGAGILSFLGWLWWRKRKVEEETSTESMFASSMLNIKKAEDNYTTPNTDVNTSYGVEAVGESSFLSEFTPSDFDAFDTSQNEIDPISEADVYLAYGRYQQAEELIRQAIKDQPDRDECKLKLLEIFYANENKNGFEAYAHELAEAGKKDQVEFWAKVTEMGNDLCPDSALFSNGEYEEAADDDESGDIFETAEQSGSEDMDTRDEMDFAAFSATPKEDADKKTGVAENKGRDFDLSSFEVEDKSLDEDEYSNNDTIDFDLSSFQTDSTKADDVAKADVEEAEGDIESFNSDLPSAKQKDSKHSGEFDLSSIGNADEGFDSVDYKDDGSFDLSADFDSESPDTDFDFNFDFNSSDAATSEDSEENAESGLSDLTDMDELETKLDLAKAYIDMGDVESAKNIAEEVLDSGSAEQKKAAQAILDELQ